METARQLLFGSGPRCVQRRLQALGKSSSQIMQVLVAAAMMADAAAAAAEHAAEPMEAATKAIIWMKEMIPLETAATTTAVTMRQTVLVAITTDVLQPDRPVGVQMGTRVSAVGREATMPMD